ncbi:PIG-L deacetylase family protein [Aquabacterium sp. J223]|uniref:PIG-L deacetylase family protein n=1 Tax=Aquabacterium sp. J223 TaxID=2898431 RepID=UPI0021AE19A3|nr:PIG-L deacetylase family protein [Aquabacterium sp. J223]UUX94796.1 PIG-L family deacetylase [Aquabacterium sp. J223]
MLDRAARALYRRLWPTARNALRTWLVLEARDRMPQPIEQFAERCVLVIAPHSDDDVIGCGGVMARHVAAGAEVHTAVMTDGRWGDGRLYSRELPAAERQRLQDELVATREREACSAAAVLGTRGVHFLGRVDGALRPDRQAVDAVRTLLQHLRPELVYLPFVYDLHEDHWQTNRVFAEAAQALDLSAARRLRVRGYEVWTPLPANRVADIGSVMGLKRAALAEFRSQLGDQDYLRLVEGLNAYRSGGPFGGRGYAEAFHETSLPAYLRLVRAATLRGGSAPAVSAPEVVVEAGR